MQIIDYFINPKNQISSYEIRNLNETDFLSIRLPSSDIVIIPLRNFKEFFTDEAPKKRKQKKLLEWRLYGALKLPNKLSSRCWFYKNAINTDVDRTKNFVNVLLLKNGHSALPYKTSGHYQLGDVINHSSFGLGGVVSKSKQQTMVVLFEDGTFRTLVHSRP